jgi:hypothetical protein
MKTRNLVLLIVLPIVGVFGLLVVGGVTIFLFMSRSMQADLGPKIDVLFAAVDDGTFKETYLTETAPELRAGQTVEQYEQVGLIIKQRYVTLFKVSR